MKPRTLVSRLDEGVSMLAAGTLAVAHDLLDMHASPELVADYLRASHALHPVTVADVWPTGTPEHWRAVA